MASRDNLNVAYDAANIQTLTPNVDALETIRPPAMIASLPMYDFPEVRPITDRWWHLLATQFRAQGFDDVPETLDRSTSTPRVWRSPALLMTQTCGYPLRFEYDAILQPLVTPIYDAPGCVDGNYASAVVVRDDNTATSFGDLAGKTLVANGPDSQSGFNAIRDLVIDESPVKPFFKTVRWSGAHRNSLRALRDAEADVAAIDPVSLALVHRYAPSELDGLRVLTHTRSVRGLPYATRADADNDLVTRLRGALNQAWELAEVREIGDQLLIDGFVDVDRDDYDAIVDMKQRAENGARISEYTETHGSD